MKQDFKLVAPHVRLAEEYGSTMADMLFVDSHKYLVELLAVPVVRKGDRREALVEPQDTSQNDSSRVQDEGSEVTSAEAIKDNANAATSKMTNHRRQARRVKPASLSGLPTEILLRITYYFEFINDVISLGLVDKRLYGIAEDELRLYFFRHFAPWANQQIACVGEDSDANDFPPGLFSEKELEAFGQEYYETYAEQMKQWNTITPCSLDNFTHPGISNMQESPISNLYSEVQQLQDCFSQDSIVDDAVMKSLLSKRDIYREYFPTDQPWILRNLTTKQFVRPEAIALKPEFIKGPHIKVLGFGDVLMSRICWSSVAPSDIKDPTNICRGIWAGHRFDVTTLTRHERKTSGDGEWTDVSDEVAQEIATIWESNLGADWREKLCEGT